MVCRALASPIAKACDAGGGALRSYRREWPGTDYWANPIQAVPLRMPSATFALLPSRGRRFAPSVMTGNKQLTRLFPGELLVIHRFRPDRLITSKSIGPPYSWPNARMGSTALARRAGT